MNSQNLFIFLILSLRALDVSSQSNDLYDKCGNTFSCGNTISEIGYPFRGSNDPIYCGHPSLVLDCHTQTNSTTIEITGTKYQVLEINQTAKIVKVAREDVMDLTTSCPKEKTNTTLDHSVFDYAPGYTNITFVYGCPVTSNVSYAPKGSSYVSCGLINNDEWAYVVPGICGPGECTVSVVVPVLDGDTSYADTGLLGQILRLGFRLRLKNIGEDTCKECVLSKGRCGYDVVTNRTACYCPYAPYFSYNVCSVATGGSPIATVVPSQPGERSRSSSTTRRDIALSAVGAVLAGIGLGWLIFYFRHRRKQSLPTQSTQNLSSGTNNPLSSSKGLSSRLSNKLTNGVTSYLSSKSDLGRGSSYFGVQVFNCTELEEATNNFDPSRELGDGGFGTVYLALLSDGRTVAVKRLYEHNFKRLEQFMNEVEILTRLRHQNLVKLYGCTSRRSRELLLVYEYIPNGTVAEHLHGARSKSGLLSWPVRLNIAVETADALTYLHKSDIIHRDVKTNNILLDSDFHVKVVDFGLSRLFPNGASHVTTAPQGTPGYVDPDYYKCYKLTEKSDVYSFGVVLIELVSSLEAVDTDRHRQDINLSSMAVSKILNRELHELVDPGLGFGRDEGVRRAVTMVAEVAFRCLQQERDMRPSMEEVLRELRGIQKEGLDARQVEIVDITDDDVELLKGIMVPASPDSGEKWLAGSAPEPGRT